MSRNPHEYLRCNTWCATYSKEDGDCELYGFYHPSPYHCEYFRRMDGNNPIVKEYLEEYDAKHGRVEKNDEEGK